MKHHSAGGLTVTKRIKDLLRGSEEAVPGDYVLALAATIGVMVAVLVEMLH